jgi:hypothetical protein
VTAEPFTIEHFAAYVGNIVLDTGTYWQLEDFQAEIVEPLLTRTQETWAILPEGNGKSTLIAGVALYFADYTPLPWIPVGAASRDQATIIAEQAYQMIRTSPGMEKRFRIYEGYRRIQPIRRDHPNPGSRGIKVYAAEVGTGDGVIPTLAICDEGHRWPNLGLYRLWRGKLRKRGGQIAMISTAGEPGGDFEQARDSIRDRAKRVVKKPELGSYARYEGGGLVMCEWKIERAADISNMEKVKAANPLSTISVQTLTEDFESPTMDLGDWKRLKCNMPARSAGAAITEAAWDAMQVEAEIPEGALIELGVDVAWMWDSFAIVPLWRGPKYRLLGQPQVLQPRGDDPVHPDDVKIAFESFMEHWRVETVVMDRGRAEDIVAWLEDDCRVRVVEWNQANSQKAIDFENWMQAMRTGQLRHNGSSVLRAHAMHAVARAMPGDRKRFDRPAQGRSRRTQDHRIIDALDAAAMVNSFVADPPTQGLAGNLADYRIQVVG